MSWESSIKAFKSYLKIERSLSDNSIVAYTRDIKKFADYAINLELSESKIERNDISNFLVLLKKSNISARSQAQNRLGASALMQGLADGYFLLPNTIGDYISQDIRTGPISTD